MQEELQVEKKQVPRVEEKKVQQVGGVGVSGMRGRRPIQEGRVHTDPMRRDNCATQDSQQ